MFHLFRISARANVATPPKGRKHKGIQYANLNVMVNRDYYNVETQEFVKQEPAWVQCLFKGNKAEHILDQAEIGDTIIFEGTPGIKIFDNKNGETKGSLTVRISDYYLHKRFKGNQDG